MYSRPGKSTSIAFELDRQVAVGNGQLKTLRVYNQGAGVVYLQFHDRATPAAAHAVPSSASIPIAPGSYYESDTPFDFLAGLYLCGSLSPGENILIGDYDLWITAEYLH